MANAGDNSVSVIDTKLQKVIEVLDAGLYPNSLIGSATNGVALSKDEKNLYIANPDNNCLAVFEVNIKGKLILGLPPMTQYDATATPMYRCFTSKPNFTPYQSVAVSVDLSEVNTAYTPSAKRSESLDFTEVDSNDDNLFNEILWKGIKGELSQLPAPRRSAFVKVVKSDLD